MVGRLLFQRALAAVRRSLSATPTLEIFAYHSVVQRRLELPGFCFLPEEEFRVQLDLLRRQFHLVSLEEGVHLLAAGEIDRSTAVLTFDDGFQDNYDVVYPALRAAGAPATIFLCTDLVGTDRVLWYCRLHDALTRTASRSLEWDGRRYPLADWKARRRAVRTLAADLKRLPHPQLEAAVDGMVERLGADPLRCADPRFRILGRDAIADMARGGLVEFGAHTGSHAILSQLDPAAQHEEIVRSITEVGALTGRPCRTFAYPNGRRVDYDRSTVEILRDAGITIALTTEQGSNDAATPPLELRRFSIGGEWSTQRFEKWLRPFGAPRAYA
jgi:peptidoglycan/xylan/chitin deacetylase (PgdA/CDA1 family)